MYFTYIYYNTELFLYIIIIISKPFRGWGNSARNISLVEARNGRWKNLQIWVGSTTAAAAATGSDKWLHLITKHPINTFILSTLRFNISAGVYIFSPRDREKLYLSGPFIVDINGALAR